MLRSLASTYKLGRPGGSLAPLQDVKCMNLLGERAAETEISFKLHKPSQDLCPRFGT